MGSKARRRSRRTPIAPPSEGRTPARGKLVVIGGHEQRNPGSIILQDLAKQVRSGRLLVCTVASDEPEALWEEYRKAFAGLGVRRVAHLDIGEREDILDKPPRDLLDEARVVFFTGGGQLKITTRFAGTMLCSAVERFYRRGGVVAGTSAGASVLADTMLVSGEGEASHRIATNLLMAPGLGFIRDVIIDQHFAERGRIGRLLGAVAQNPRLLGLGIDEDTAVLIDRERTMNVLGTGAVYVADARDVTYTNVAEESPDRTLSIFDVRLHVLSQGDEFDLVSRRPTHRFASSAENGRPTP
ncbi:MAG TPA: cyanophycinase [Gemmatimonadales bacterium]